MEIVKHRNYASILVVTLCFLGKFSFSQTPFHKDNQRTVLVTGAASGIGKAIALRFQIEGYEVYATDIDTTKWHDHLKAGCKVLYLDVTDEEAIQDAFEQIKKNGDKIDILINNAGYGQNGFLEELPLQSIRNQFEVNVFSIVRLSQLVAPEMRKSGDGLIINIGSVGGDFTSPGASAYHASKYAVESFNDGLRQELNQFGINVVLIKPGGVNTNFTENALPHYPKPIESSPYSEQREQFLKMTETVLNPEKSNYPILEPEDVANKVFKAATKKKPKTRYRVGITAKLMPTVKAMRSDRGLDKMLWKQIKKQR